MRGFGAAAMNGAPLFDGALQLHVIVNLERPVSWSKRKRAENPFPTGKPDLDNLTKTVMDAGNHILWADDSQIVKLEATKTYAVENETVINVFPALE